jgi:phosphonopyruvate decarboxylase
MVAAEKLFNILKKKKIFFYSGVPDSILKPFINILESRKDIQHLISANEGTAVSNAIGYYLSSGKLPCVYFQNSGLGNAINPLVSIAHQKVYAIPMILVIGWRGATKNKDEPQHRVKGQITKKILSILGIQFVILEKENDLKNIKKKITECSKNNKIIAILIKNQSIKNEKNYKISSPNKNKIERNFFINSLLKKIEKDTNIISTTGYTSRELMQLRKDKKNINGKDFYMVGGMGHASSVALGVSMNNKKTICIDGDGSLIMHMGSLITNSVYGNKKFRHIVLNNNSHESVGGYTTNAKFINFKLLSKSLNYKNFFQIKFRKELNSRLNEFLKKDGPSLLEVLIKNKSSNNLMRPKNLIYLKNKFMKKK